ncbi:MAG: M36 family metallopeptidase [Candidatus Eremiobacterota bacterium]
MKIEVKINNISSHPERHKVKTGNNSLKDTVSIGSRKDTGASYYPQDPSVSEPVLTKIAGTNITPGPDNERIDTNGDVKPRSDGNFIYSPEEPEFINVQTFVTVDKVINMTEKFLGKKIPWSFGRDKIIINPDKGVMANAFYNKKDGTLNFFHFKDKKTGQTIQTGKSFDIGAHETGHARLDGMKPNFLKWNIETEAIHEAFSDIISMLASLQEDKVCELFLKETGGDFRKENLLSRIGEQFGQSVMGKPSIRSAINSYTYSNPYLLPQMQQEDELTGEAHVFGQLFVGAFYDIMEKVFHQYVSQGMAQKEALTKMSNTCGKLFMKAIDICPPSEATYKDIAQAMIKVDQMEEKGKYKNILKDVFEKRWILFEDKEIPQEIRGSKFINPSDRESIVSFIDRNRELTGFSGDTPLKIEKTEKNKDGSTIIDLTYTQEVPLRGSDYGIFDGAMIEITGGVNIMSDSGGEVCSLASRAVDRDNIENTKNRLKNLIKEGRIKFIDPSVKKIEEKDLFDNKGIPYAGYTLYEDGKMKIVPSTVIQ